MRVSLIISRDNIRLQSLKIKRPVVSTVKSPTQFKLQSLRIVGNHE